MPRLREVSKALILGACLLLGSLKTWAIESAYPKAVAKGLTRASSTGQRFLELSAVSPAEFEHTAGHLGLLSGLTPEELDSQRGGIRLDLTIRHWQDRGAELAVKPIDSAPLSPVHAAADARDARTLTKKIPAILDKKTLEDIQKRLPKLEQDAREAIATASDLSARLAQERKENPAPPPKEEVFKLASNLRLLQVTPRPREGRIHRAILAIVVGVLEDTSISGPRNARVVKLAEYVRDLGCRFANPAAGLTTPSENYVVEKTNELIKAYLAKVDDMALAEKSKDTRRAKIRALERQFNQIRESKENI